MSDLVYRMPCGHGRVECPFHDPACRGKCLPSCCPGGVDVVLAPDRMLRLVGRLGDTPMNVTVRGILDVLDREGAR